MKLRMIAFLLIAALLLGTLAGCDGGEREGYIPTPIILSGTLETYEFGVAFRQGNAALRDQVDAALQVLAADGTVSQIARFWFGYDPTIIRPNLYAVANLGEVRERTTFIVGFDVAAAPMSFFNPAGELVGFDIDLARAVADYFDWTLELLPIQWGNREFELASGNIDALWGGVTLAGRIPDRLYYTNPYMRNNQVFVTMSNSGIRNMRGVRGNVVAIRSDSAAEWALAENESFRDRLHEIEIHDSLCQALLAFEQGYVDAVLMDEVAAIFYIRTGDTDAFGCRMHLAIDLTEQ
ncbi:MAG: transporter substrate-binding domain-containing protein [Oscillospiraceae bacterium]|nr:transporter substrate-binding domain-containing protein [Oscillospiraceae bacterium]